MNLANLFAPHTVAVWETVSATGTFVIRRGLCDKCGRLTEVVTRSGVDAPVAPASCYRAP